MKSHDQLPFDIAIVGLGVVGTHQITREGEETMKRCERIFVLDTAAGIVRYLRTLCPNVTNLMSASVLGKHRRLIYRRIASTVVAAALEQRPVCFATYGHPKLYSYPTILIQRAAKVLDLRIRLLAGISSLDNLLVELNLEPGFDGLQMYDATDLVVRRRPLQTDVSCVVMQPSIVLQAYNQPGLANMDNLRPLQNYLLEFYPADHNAILVISRTHPLLKSVKQKIPLGKLAGALQQTSHLSTLFIPPVRRREIADQKLASRMKLPATTASQSVPQRPGRPAIGPKPG